jgi:hypothetical protein
MKRNARNAFNALKKAGITVIDPDREWGGHFAISGEAGDLNGLDYWADAGGDSTPVPGILNKYKLYYEWVNAGVAAVYDA